MKSKYGTGPRLTNENENWNQLIEEVGQAKDKVAFSKLFAHFSPNLKAFLLRGGSITSEQADEMVQETMIKVWRKAPTYSAAHASASTWIFTIARNTRIDWFRKHAKEDPSLLNAEDLYESRDNPTPYSSLVRVRTSRNMTEQLRLLPTEQAEVLQLMYYEGKSGQEVAKVLNVPLGTVKSRIRLALAKLKIGLSPTYGSQE